MSNHPDPAVVSRIKAGIKELVERMDCVSFVELDERVPGFAEEGSTNTIGVAGAPTIVVWSEVSREGALAFAQAQAEGSIHAAPASYWVYTYDGKGLKLPVLRAFPEEPPQDPHWFPMVLRAGRSPGPVRNKPSGDAGWDGPEAA